MISSRFLIHPANHWKAQHGHSFQKVFSYVLGTVSLSLAGATSVTNPINPKSSFSNIKYIFHLPYSLLRSLATYIKFGIFSEPFLQEKGKKI